MNRRSFLKLLASVPIIGAVAPPAIVSAAHIMPVRAPRLYTGSAGYIVFENFDLSDFHDRVPSFTIEFEGADSSSLLVSPQIAYLGDLIEHTTRRGEFMHYRYSAERIAYEAPIARRVKALFADGKPVPLSAARFANSTSKIGGHPDRGWFASIPTAHHSP